MLPPVSHKGNTHRQYNLILPMYITISSSPLAEFNTVTSFLSFTNPHARVWSEAWRVLYIIIALLWHPVIELVVQS